MKLVLVNIDTAHGIKAVFTLGEVMNGRTVVYMTLPRGSRVVG